MWKLTSAKWYFPDLFLDLLLKQSALVREKGFSLSSFIIISPDKFLQTYDAREVSNML